jgi:hypothetical protein
MSESKVVDLQSRLARKAAEQADFSEHMDRAGEMFKIMKPAIEQMRALGADSQAIALVLRVVLDALEEDESGKRS